MFNWKNMVKKFLESKHFEPNMTDAFQQTILNLAVSLQEPNLEIIKMILEKKTDPNIKDFKGKTAFHYAVSDRDLTMLFLNLKNVDINAQDNLGNTPAHLLFESPSPRIEEANHFLLREDFNLQIKKSWD